MARRTYDQLVAYAISAVTYTKDLFLVQYVCPIVSRQIGCYISTIKNHMLIRITYCASIIMHLSSFTGIPHEYSFTMHLILILTYRPLHSHLHRSRCFMISRVAWVCLSISFVFLSTAAVKLSAFFLCLSALFEHVGLLAGNKNNFSKPTCNWIVT